MIGTAVDPDAARDDVRAILDDRRFRDEPAPRPFRGPLEWLGDRLNTVGGWLADFVRWVPAPVWLSIGVLALAAFGWWLARRVTRSGRARSARAHGRAATAPHEDAATLEREADEAERRGDFDRAVRLRFRAGLLRLGDRGAIDYRPSLTTAEVRRILGSDTFDGLAETFDEVTYGGAAAQPPDVSDARAKWPRVVEEGRRT